jgi:hypothetical protein
MSMDDQVRTRPLSTPLMDDRQLNLSYSLVRLKPSRRQKSRCVEPPQDQKSKQKATHGSLSRWVFVYLPILALILLVMYVVVELMIKHLAVRTVREHAASLPETIENLPLAPMSSKSVNSKLPQMEMTAEVGANRDFGYTESWNFIAPA